VVEMWQGGIKVTLEDILKSRELDGKKQCLLCSAESIDSRRK
jgi:hypothetical protein